MPIDLLILLWLGATFGYCARERLRSDGLWAQPSLSLVASFLVLVVVPTGAYLYLVHPAWSWLFLLDPGRMSWFMIFTVLAMHAAALLGAYVLAGRLARQGKDVILRWCITIAPAIILVVILVLRGRVFHYGSYGQFHGGQALPLFSVKLGYVLCAVAVGAFCAAVVVARELLRDGRRAATR
jgi:hypothetical protein